MFLTLFQGHELSSNLKDKLKFYNDAIDRVKYVKDWYSLGINLELPTNIMEELTVQYGSDKSIIKEHMLYQWFRISTETSKGVLNAAITKTGNVIILSLQEVPSVQIQIM